METKRDVYMRIFYIAMFAFVLLWIPLPWEQEPARNPISETRIRIERILDGIQFLIHYDDKFMSNALNAPETEDMLDFLFEGFSTCPDIAMVSYEKTDAWGNRFNIRIDETPINSITNVLSQSLNQIPIRIWSSGPNGINEDGNGDDIE